MVNRNDAGGDAKSPKAIFMMGGPASGKSTVREQLFSGLTAIDCDAIKATHPDYDPKNPQLVHEWSSQEATRAFYAALGTGVDVVFDGTGNTAEKYVTFIQTARSAGYTTEVVYVTCDLQTAIARNAARERTVDENIVRSRHATIATSFEIVSRYADAVRVVRT